MVGLRKQMARPDHTYFPQAQPFSITVDRKVFVQQSHQLHLLHVSNQQRDIIDPFGLNAQGFFHVLQLIRILKLRPGLSER